MIRYLLAALLVASTGTAFAASGGSPNGKPFVEINDQLVAVQGDVDSIKDQIESLTSRVESIEEESAAVSAKLDQTIATQTALSDLVAQIEIGTTTLASSVSHLESESASLASQIEALGGTDTELQAQIDTNQALLISLQLALSEGLDSVVNELDQLDEMAFYLEIEQTKIQEELRLKQNLIEGTCANDEFLAAVSSDGSVVCRSPETNSPVEVITVHKTFPVSSCSPAPNYCFEKVPCPNYAIPIGGYVVSVPMGDVELIRTEPSFQYGYVGYRFVNTAYRRLRYIEVAAQCMKGAGSL